MAGEVVYVNIGFGEVAIEADVEPIASAAAVVVIVVQTALDNNVGYIRIEKAPYNVPYDGQNVSGQQKLDLLNTTTESRFYGAAVVFAAVV